MENEFTLGVVSAAQGGKVCLVRDCQEQNIPIYAPYGYAFCPPVGDSMCTALVEGATAAGAVPMPAHNLPAGEVKISAGGGYIHLKNSGEIEINGLTITADGQILPPAKAGE